VLIHEHYFDDIILVINYWLSVTRANCMKQLDKLLISVLDLAKINDLFNDAWGYLGFKQLFVVVN